MTLNICRKERTPVLLAKRRKQVVKNIKEGNKIIIFCVINEWDTHLRNVKKLPVFVKKAIIKNVTLFGLIFEMFVLKESR